jgi:hypothetical protein
LPQHKVQHWTQKIYSRLPQLPESAPLFLAINQKDLVETTPPDVPTLRELMRIKGLTLEAVELLSATTDDGGVDPATTSRVARGLQQPSRKTVVKLARGCSTSVRTMTEIVKRSAEAALEAKGTAAQ